MSIKRQATTELNHDNWDQEDPTEHEEMGAFKAAPKDVLEKRVIRTAKRRSQISNDEPKKSVFSGFGGFNKTQPSSFNFLANLTNGSKNTNGTSTISSSETAVTSSLFSSKPTTGLFGNSTSSTPTKPTFGSSTFQSSPQPVASPAKPTSSETPSIFTASKADSTSSDVKNSPFKIQSVTSSVDTNVNTKATSSLFGVSSTSANQNKSTFSSTNSTPFKIQPVSSTTTSVQNTFGITKVTNSNEPDKKSEDNNEKKMKYYAKLKGLNESVSDWIKKHVEQTPLCILTPIFKDYEKYLKEIQDEYLGSEKEKSNMESKTESSPLPSKNQLFSTNNTNSKSIFGNSNNISTSDKPPTNFGSNVTSSTTSSATMSNAGFSFGVTSSSSATAPPPSSTTTTTTANSENAPFSFGIGKPFSFSSNIQQQKTEAKTENEDDDEPPKVEFTPIVEENSVYDKRCKIFVKKDGNFVDKGLGTLYIRKIEETGKHQLLVRANTNLGTVLLNLILGSAIPMQRMGKNNVMLVCIPTPDFKPPPTPILIRVKTGEEADELLETLNKYKS